MIIIGKITEGCIVATYKWIEEEGIFYGRIANTIDLISFEGKTFEEMLEDFKNTVKAYKTAKEIKK